MKIKHIIILFAFFSIFSSCEENDHNNCNTNNPLEDLAWLKEAKENIDRVDCAARSSITQYTYKSKTVFEVNICSNIADGQTLVYDCEGEIICKFGGIIGENTCPNFYDIATNKIILYGN